MSNNLFPQYPAAHLNRDDTIAYLTPYKMQCRPVGRQPLAGFASGFRRYMKVSG